MIIKVGGPDKDKLLNLLKENDILYKDITYRLFDELIGLEVREIIDGDEEEIALDGLFVAIGLEPKNAVFSDVAALSDGYFDSGENCFTKTAGVFAAGDCRKKTIRQITTAVADGAAASLAACRYIDNL